MFINDFPLLVQHIVILQNPPARIEVVRLHFPLGIGHCFGKQFPPDRFVIGQFIQHSFQIFRPEPAHQIIIQGKEEPKDAQTQSADRPQDESTEQASDPQMQISVEAERRKGNGSKDVAGMSELKKMVQEKIIFVLKNKDLAEKYRLTPPNGMLLYGPPGCGKTFLAEKFAEQSRMNYMLVKSSDLASTFVHGTQEKIRKMFDLAESLTPCILCIDELDAIAGKRSSMVQETYAMEVNEMLSQLNNCSERGIFVIGSTNRPEYIDPALLRRGRLDEAIYVPMPDNVMREAVLRLRLKNVYRNGIKYTELANLTEGYVVSDIEAIVNKASLIAARLRQPVTQQFMEQAIRAIRPSVSSSQLREYEAARKRMMAA